MALQQKGFQDPTYVGRLAHSMNVAAGAATLSAPKFLAFASVQIMSVTTLQNTLGTSTYTVGGVGTASSQQLNLIVITNTSTTTTAALATSTFGPYYAGGAGTAAQVNVALQYQVNTNTSTAGQGGVLVPQGSLVYVVSGTDATAASTVSFDYQITAGAAVTI
jgi:hypothetical protein